MAESVLFAYKQKFGVLPSRPSQLIAFSKLNDHVKKLSYIEARTVLNNNKNRHKKQPPNKHQKSNTLTIKSRPFRKRLIPPPPPVIADSTSKLSTVSIESLDTNFNNNYSSNYKREMSQRNRREKYKKHLSKYSKTDLNINPEQLQSDDVKIEDEVKNADFGDIEESEELKKRQRLRKRAVDELVTTEKTYLSNLEKLFKIFVNPLKNSQDKRIRRLLSDQDHAILFPSDLSTIYALHIQLNADLIKATTKWNQETSKIGHIFIKYGELFKMYQDYFHKHEKAVQHLAKLEKKNSKVKKI